MKNLTIGDRELKLPWMRFLPLAAFGAIIFSATSAANLNEIFTIYLVLLEAKLGILFVYFLAPKFFRLGRKTTHRHG